MLNLKYPWIKATHKVQHIPTAAAKRGTVLQKLRLILISGSVSLLGACGTGAAANNPHSTGGSVPGELVGGWYNGSVSSVNFYDPSTGHWGAPSGSGLFYTFTSDGKFTNGYMTQSSLYGCVTFFMIWLEGSVDVQGSSMRFHATSGQKKFNDLCDTSNDEDRPLTSGEINNLQSSFNWQLVRDESNANQTDLVMTLPDGSPWATFGPHSGF